MAEVRLTKEGVEKYEKRLEYLKTTGRTEIAEQIKIARSFGDLSENAEYDAAKIEQARMEYEIVEIEAMLRNVVIIDEDNINTDVVNVGNTITVKNNLPDSWQRGSKPHGEAHIQRIPRGQGPAWT